MYQLSSTGPPGRRARQRAMLSQAVSLESDEAERQRLASSVGTSTAVGIYRAGLTPPAVIVDLIRDVAGFGDRDPQRRNDGGGAPVIRGLYSWRRRTAST